MSHNAYVANVLEMPRRKAVDRPETDQVNFRFPRPLLDRMERFKERHTYHPTLTMIAINAVTEWLDAHESELPPEPKPKR